MAFKNEQQGGKIKPSGYHMDMTLDQVSELIKCTDDVLYFVEKYCWITHPTKGRVKFKLFDYQKKLLVTYEKNRNVIAMLSRQCGKTTSAAAYLLWWAIFKDDQTVLVASNKGDGAKEIMGRLKFMYEELPWFLKPGVKENNVFSISFDNNSKVEAQTTTATTGRGKAISLIYLDEFAYVPPNIAGEFWTSLYPVLSTGGKCIITSTPNNDEDKFAKIWFNSTLSELSDVWEDKMMDRSKFHETEEDKYETIFESEETRNSYLLDVAMMDNVETDETNQGFVGFHAHWTSVPQADGTFRGEAFKRANLAAGLTEEEWNREFECSFISADATLITPATLLAIGNTIKPPRFIDKWGCRWYEEIKANAAYAVSMDPSEGVGLDYACIQVWRIPEMVQVAEWHNNTYGQVEQTRMLSRVLRRIHLTQEADPDHNGENNIYFSVERNGLGIGILTAIEMTDDEHLFPGWLIDSTMKSINIRSNTSYGMDRANRYRGLVTSNSSKSRYCLEFKSLIERGIFKVRSKHLYSQLKTFVKSGSGWAAKTGKKDDIVMACIVACHLIDEVRTYEPNLDDLITPDLDSVIPTQEMSLLPMV